MEQNKIAVILPGIGYHKDKPLLYYAAKLAKQHGYEIISVEYHDMPQKIRGNAEMMAFAAELAIAQSRDALQNIPINSDTELLLIGKSIGTIAAAQFSAECDANIRQIWYTPLEATFAIGSQCSCIAFLGEDDPWSDVEKVKHTLMMLEEEELIKDILHAHMGDGLEVTIGQENEDSQMKDSSIITATYHLNGELLGTIAVLGPTRMEYAKAMSLLEYMNDNLTEVIRKYNW